ncbi:MAG: glycosyltransferase family 2 protein [Acidimicrobiales bacterium]
MSDVRAPAVVAVIVAHDPGPWFDEVLEAWAQQDYEELSVLVLVSGGGEDPTETIARHLPGAFVRRLETNAGFGAAINEAIGMVEGAAFLALCHDDCAPDPDAVHLMVEESYRSNAGIVTPKIVHFDDPSRLLHVGMNADKTGAVVERVRPDEVDHGQHDTVRDVFVAPGGLNLVRSDLLVEIGGYDDGIVAMGEDLDLSWRAQITGARVVVAPQARARHLEGIASGTRDTTPLVAGELARTLQALQRRHELRAVLKNYKRAKLLSVLPQAFLLALGELVVSLAVGDSARAKAISSAWVWNLTRLADVRARRKAVKASRVISDSELRRLQLRGSARLSTYFSRVTHEGLDVAHGRSRAERGGDRSKESGRVPDEPVLTGSVGSAFSEDSDFDELDDLGHRSGLDRFGRKKRGQPLLTHRSRLVVWALAILVAIVGFRGIISGGLPAIGQFAHLAALSTTWHEFVAGWQPAGVGTTAPATPGFAVIALVATLMFQSMGLAHTAIVVACLPLGVLGIARLLRPLCSPRARLTASLCYFALPLYFSALNRGRLDDLVAYAAVPWIVSKLLSAGRIEQSTAASSKSLVLVAVKLGVVEAIAVAFAPAVAPVVLVCAVAIVAGSVLVGDKSGSIRVVAAALLATVVAAVLCAPWVVGVVLSGRQAVGVFGLLSAAASTPGWADLTRFALGPEGVPSSPLIWGLVAAALLPLLIAKHERLSLAGRLWSVGCFSWVLALAVSKGWMGSFSPAIGVVLVPAAVAVASCVGLGISAFEEDLSDYHFGWRQVLSVLALVAIVLGLLPVIAASGGGRWGLASIGYSDQVTSIPNVGAPGQFRVLWLGDPAAMPVAGWGLGRGLSYATTQSGSPDSYSIFAPASPGPASELGDAVLMAMSGRTIHIGRLLAPAGVRYVVVVESVAPSIPGVQASPPVPPPPSLLPSLREQVDLKEVSAGQGIDLFVNTEAVPVRAQRPLNPVPHGSRNKEYFPVSSDLAGFGPVLPAALSGPSFSGHVGPGTVVSAYAPSSRWNLSVNGAIVKNTRAFGWGSQYQVRNSGSAVLTFSSSPLMQVGIAFEVLAWLVVAGVLLERRRWLNWWWVPLRHYWTKRAGTKRAGKKRAGSVEGGQ